MSTLSSKGATLLREHAAEASRQTTRSVLLLGKFLYETFHAAVTVAGKPLPVWFAWGFQSWDDYVERELGLHKTTAMKMRRIHEVFGLRFPDWDREFETSFTKFYILTRVVTRSTVNSWLRKAQKMSCCELEEDVQNHLYGGKSRGPIRMFAAPVRAKDLSFIKEVLDGASEDFPKSTRGEVLTAILREWAEIRARARKAA